MTPQELEEIKNAVRAAIREAIQENEPIAMGPIGGARGWGDPGLFNPDPPPCKVSTPLEVVELREEDRDRFNNVCKQKTFQPDMLMHHLRQAAITRIMQREMSEILKELNGEGDGDG